MATDLFLEMAELPALPATGSLGTGQLDTRDLLVAGVPISISSKYLYLYLELSGSTCRTAKYFIKLKNQTYVFFKTPKNRKHEHQNYVVDTSEEINRFRIAQARWLSRWAS